MKTKIYLLIIAIGLLSWSCTTQNDLSSSSLKSSINSNITELNTAMAAIASTDGYQVIGISDTESAASKVSSSTDFVIDSTMKSIMLADIAGIYSYKAYTYSRGVQPILRFFEKTGDSDSMIVSLPEEKVKRPGSLKYFSVNDSNLVNNYKLSLTQYDYTFNRILGWNYQMASNINIKNVDAGNLKIQSSKSATQGYKYASEFEFADGYKASCTYASSDTAVSTYAITKGENTLYKESYSAIKGSMDKRHKEREYTLTIGDVKIVRSSNFGKATLDSAKVYVNNVLQTNATIAIVDIESTDATDNSIVNHKRELRITFDDGTSNTISELLGTSVVTIRTLFASLRQASFATSVIDRIAWDIYLNKE